MKRVAPVLASVILIGCGRSPVGRAYVNVERVAQGDPLTIFASDPAPSPPGASPGESHAIPPLAARKLDFSENKARLEKVQQAVNEAREQTARQIAGKLREAYLREIETVENERMLKIGDVKNEALTKAWAKVRARFLTHANARAPHAIKLALYAGFPDPDPLSKRIPPEGNALKRQLERARIARSALVDLDSAYETDVRSLLAEYSDEVAAAINAIRTEIEQMRAEAEARAVRDAAAQVAELAQQVESVLSGKAEVNLAARPGRSATIPSGQALPPTPVIPSTSREQAEADRLDAVRSDAKIWASHFGVELVSSPKSGPDRTDEFIAWRKQRQLGP